MRNYFGSRKAKKEIFIFALQHFQKEIHLCDVGEANVAHMPILQHLIFFPLNLCSKTEV